MDSVRSEFEWLIPERDSDAPGTYRTMVIGDGPYNVGGLHGIHDLVSVAGPWIDQYKIVWAAFPFQPKATMDEKLALLDDHDIDMFLGGNFFEAAVQVGHGERFVESAYAAGCPGIEVSSTAIEMSVREKAKLVAHAAEIGLDVHAEIGKKGSETGGETVSTTDVIEEMETCLNAGAEFVIFEMEEIDASIGKAVRTGTPLDEAAADRFRRILDAVSYENIMFEVPLGGFYEALPISWWFIDEVGPDVNLGNVHPYHVLLVEQQRRGIGPYTF